jgi:hypothetical protein
MAEDAGGTESVDERGDKERIRDAVGELLEGHDFQVQELAYELLITNALDLDKGRIHVEFEGGHMSLQRVVWEYLGQLPGFEEDGESRVTVDMIARALGRGM